MNVVTTYLYGSLHSDIYIKFLDGIFVSNTNTNRNMYCVKLIKSLYDLKQSGRMWYNRLKEFLINKGYSNSDDCPCVFIRKSKADFYIISVYVDDLNINGRTKDIDEAHNQLKNDFKMKDLGKTNFYLGLQIEHLQTGILVHQFAYVQKVLEKINMNKACPLITSMIVRVLEKDIDPFRPTQEGEEILGAEYTYLSVISALMYLVNNDRPDIAFTVNYLTWHSATSTMHH
jgi:hypothetical protein